MTDATGRGSSRWKTFGERVIYDNPRAWLGQVDVELPDGSGSDITWCGCTGRRRGSWRRRQGTGRAGWSTRSRSSRVGELRVFELLEARVVAYPAPPVPSIAAMGVPTLAGRSPRTGQALVVLVPRLRLAGIRWFG